MKKILLLLSSVFLVVGCNVVPPEDDMKGAPASKQEIQAAFAEAQSGVVQEQAYKLGDYGTIRIIDQVLSNSQVVSTHDLKIEEINDKYIIYSERVAETGETAKYGIERKQGSTTPAPPKEPIGKNFLLDKLMGLVAKVVGVFKKVEISRPTAIGQERPERLVLNKPSSIATKSLRINGITSNAAPSSTSAYYDLKVMKHPYETANCAQIPDCKVNATRITYYEVRSLSDGTTMKMKWIYEISKEVPGLFMILDECYSTIVQQGTNQIPFMECASVKDFRFGN